MLPDPENHTENSGEFHLLPIGVSNVIAFNLTDREEDQEEAAPLPPLTSLIPIIETLPGLVLEDNTYVSSFFFSLRRYCTNDPF